MNPQVSGTVLHVLIVQQQLSLSQVIRMITPPSLMNPKGVRERINFFLIRIIITFIGRHMYPFDVMIFISTEPKNIKTEIKLLQMDYKP